MDLRTDGRPTILFYAGFTSMSRNPTKLAEQMYDRLLKVDGYFWHFHEREDINRVRTAIAGTSS